MVSMKAISFHHNNIEFEFTVYIYLCWASYKKSYWILTINKAVCIRCALPLYLPSEHILNEKYYYQYY